MAVFGYKATDASGKIVEGVIDAADERIALERLRESDLFPIRIWSAAASEKGTAELPRPLRGKARAARKDLLPFLNGFKTLLAAGMPMDRALEMLAELFRDASMGSVSSFLLREVRGGSSLSDAMRKAPGAPFGRFLIQMAQAGQSTGRLEEALDQAYRYMNRDREFKASVMSALLYPAILLCASILSAIILVTFVVPRFSGMFASSGVLLPLPTRILLSLSGFLREYAIFIVVAIAAIWVFARAAFARPEMRKAWDRGKMKWPLVGKTLNDIETSRVLHSLSSLLTGGVPILPALVIAREVSGNMAVRDGLEAAHQRIQGGTAIAKALGESTPFPLIALQMIAVGEETGRLEAMLASVANACEDDARRGLSRFLTVLEPVVILFMGLLVGFIVFSIFLAVFRLSEAPF
ncbi:MAG: type II secretion system F family protein [Syntrophorhabdaceae bacterium]|nr:type II secretion system F family protein [Syntrophorhabdaceae bacterium]